MGVVVWGGGRTDGGGGGKEVEIAQSQYKNWIREEGGGKTDGGGGVQGSGNCTITIQKLVGREERVGAGGVQDR